MAKIIMGNDTAEITHNRPNLANVIAGVSWRMTEYTPKDLYFDLVMYGLSEDGYCHKEDYIIYYANKELKTRREDIFKHMDVDEVIKDDELKTEDYEQVLVGLYEVPNEIKEIVFCAGIYDAYNNGYTLSQLEDLRFRIFNEENKEILVTSEYVDYFNIESCVVFGRLFRSEEGGWKYRGENQGYTGDIGTLHAIYTKSNDGDDPERHIIGEESSGEVEEGYGHDINSLIKEGLGL